MLKTLIAIWFSAGLFVNALLFVPQIYKLLKVKDPTGVSLLTFGGFVLIQLPIILHGYIIGDYLLFWGYLLSLATCGTVVVLIIYYKIKNRKKQK